MKTTQEQIEVMKAYVEGKKIQLISLYQDNPWKDIDPPAWDWANFDYRIKPEPKKRLLTAKELYGKWVRKQYKCGGSFDMLVTCVKEYDPNKVFCSGSEIEIVNDLLYTGTPADDSSWKSVLVEEKQ